MKYLLNLIIFSLIILSVLCSCNKNVSVKLIEEHDPVVKILEERDSMVIFPTDSNKNKQSQKH
jgi:hypothetical protein